MKVNASAKKEDRYTDMSESLTFLFDRKTPESSVKVSFSFSDNSSFDNDTKEKIKQDRNKAKDINYVGLSCCVGTYNHC